MRGRGSSSGPRPSVAGGRGGEERGRPGPSWSLPSRSWSVSLQQRTDTSRGPAGGGGRCPRLRRPQPRALGSPARTWVLPGHTSGGPAASAARSSHSARTSSTGSSTPRTRPPTACAPEEQRASPGPWPSAPPSLPPRAPRSTPSRTVRCRRLPPAGTGARFTLGPSSSPDHERASTSSPSSQAPQRNEAGTEPPPRERTACDLGTHFCRKSHGHPRRAGPEHGVPPRATLGLKSLAPFTHKCQRRGRTWSWMPPGEAPRGSVGRVPLWRVPSAWLQPRRRSTLLVPGRGRRRSPGRPGTQAGGRGGEQGTHALSRDQERCHSLPGPARGQT